MLKKLYALKNKKGFTLVELMVVVAILGILVAVAVPVYNNATTKAETNTCAANIRTIQSAIMTAQVSGAVVTTKGENGKYTSATINEVSITADGVTPTAAKLVPDYLQADPKCPSDKSKGYLIYLDATNGILVKCTANNAHTVAAAAK